MITKEKQGFAVFDADHGDIAPGGCRIYRYGIFCRKRCLWQGYGSITEIQSLSVAYRRYGMDARPLNAPGCSR